jgi:hypothetical protein
MNDLLELRLKAVTSGDIIWLSRVDELIKEQLLLDKQKKLAEEGDLF